MYQKHRAWCPTLWISLAPPTKRVPHPFAFCAKGWEARTSTTRVLDLRVRGSHPCKERKDGAPSVVVVWRKMAEFTSCVTESQVKPSGSPRLMKIGRASCRERV